MLFASATDRVQRHQAVSNLVANAVKFTPPGGRIEVSVEQANEPARLTVEDTGEGVEPKVLPHIFDRFRQADSSPMRTHGGLGLGLALARHLVQAQQGPVRAESEGKEKGAALRYYTVTGRGSVSAILRGPVVQHASYHAPSARLAHERTLECFRKHIG